MPSPNFKMPSVSLGPCVWYGESNPVQGTIGVPAIITETSDRSVNLTVWPPDNRAGIPKSGVRHRSDPELLEHPGYDGGCWEHTASESRLQTLEVELAYLTDTVADLKNTFESFK